SKDCSVYSYMRKMMGEYSGFFVGWAARLDYILLPMLNAFIIRIYMEHLFPHIPSWIWVIVYVMAVTGINIYSMKSTSSLNLILVGFTLILMFFFSSRRRHTISKRDWSSDVCSSD